MNLRKAHRCREMDQATGDQVTFGEAVRTFGKIGLLSFGGPAGQISLMHRILVEEKRWIDDARFLHALNYCMLLPGPEAMQLATYVGWLLHGVRGGLVAGLLFVLPGAVVITGLCAVYLLAGDVPVVEGLLFGMKAAVLAIVLDALMRISGRALKGRDAVAIAVAAFAAIALLKLPFPLIIAAAALYGALAWRARPPAHAAAAILPGPAAAVVLAGAKAPTLRSFIATVATWIAVWFAPLAVIGALLGPAHVYAVEASFFSKVAMVTFGGAYAVLAYVAQQAVAVHGWLMPDEMLTGIGLAETTPGPLILVLVFVGFLGGARLSGFDPLVGGIGGAAITLWFTFAPCFLWIFAGAPYVERVRNIRWLTGALAAVTAAVVGVIANLAVWFGLHVLFANVGEASFGPLVLPVIDWASIDIAAASIAVAAAIALVWLKANMLAVLGAAMVVGVVISLV